MELIIVVVITLVIIGGIAAFMLMRTGKGREYEKQSGHGVRARKADAFPDSGDEIKVPPVKVPPVKYDSGQGSLTPYLIGGFRALIGLAAIIALVLIFNTTRAAVAGNPDAGALEITQFYAEGIFYAVMTIGGAAALYIFSRFIHH